MTSDQIDQLFTLLNHIDQTMTSAYTMIGFLVCVILPLLGLIWFLKKILAPFYGEYF